jgi:hypothetical protein
LDPKYRQREFKANGFVHLKNILDDEFRCCLMEFYKRSIFGGVQEIGAWKIYGKKRQYLFDFTDHGQADAFRNGMSRLIGIDPETFTISERHLKVYDQDAAPWPAPHKDRAASEVSIGLPIMIPPGSSACMFPELQFGPNREERAIFLRSDEGDDQERLYRGEGAVMLHEELGDVIAFLGSSIFHERARPAGAAILYIKVNGSGHDPLGENVYATGAKCPGLPREDNPALVVR